MFRALIEMLLTIAVVLVARAVLSSILRGIASASSNAFQNQSARPPGNQGSGKQGSTDRRWTEPPAAAGLGGELHKDPVCGTYVAEAAALRRQVGGHTFYYCSENCREKHSLVAR